LTLFQSSKTLVLIQTTYTTLFHVKQWLYPFTKDYGNPENAEQAAKSYNEYRCVRAYSCDMFQNIVD